MSDFPLSRGAAVELLAPAKNAEFGQEAILHGADAVYIGGPAFGARANAGNSLADIAQLCEFAHRFNARVLVALNTILKDEELEPARKLAWQAFEAGADALIVQDMGLLSLDLPPIALHASTQTDIRHAEKARFLQDVGFSQLVLARELSLRQIEKIAAQTTLTLEFFVHGALCVCYSGLCNISHAQTGRSANRGDCSQACRLPYSLADQQGQMIATEQHLLSLKDNNQSANLGALIDAGIRSFKIEGRLKDLSYVKNISAFYRQELDAILQHRPDLKRSSAGKSEVFFTPQAEKTFNRGASDYFVQERSAAIGAFDSPKFKGEEIGAITKIGHAYLELSSTKKLNNGDGFTYFDAQQKLAGLRANTVEAIKNGFRLVPSLSPNQRLSELNIGTLLYRNHDQAFARLLEKKSAERRIEVHLSLSKTETGFALQMDDESGISAQAEIIQAPEIAQHPEKSLAALRENLSKLGDTIYIAPPENIKINLDQAFFIPASKLNQLRRAAVLALDTARKAAYQRAPRLQPIEPPALYPEDSLSYLSNVYNASAREFYVKHGVRVIAPAYEYQQEKGDVSLMITKHCLRYSFNLCPKEVKGLRPEPLLLLNGKEKLTLHFDCKACEMHVIGRLKVGRPIRLRVLENSINSAG